MGGPANKLSAWHTWIWIMTMVAIIFGTGFYCFTVVSDKGPPTWDYRTVRDLPSESPYATYKKLPFPQHVKGKGGQ